MDRNDKEVWFFIGGDYFEIIFENDNVFVKLEFVIFVSSFG